MTRKVQRRQEVDLLIEKVAFGGKGIARLDDYVVFVENTLPGDRVRARIKKAKSGYAEAWVVETYQPSEMRGSAPCKHFGTCGGCKWQHVEYQQQLAFKRQHVEESLRHIGKVDPGVIHPVLPAPRLFGYRNKMEFSFTANRWLTAEELADQTNRKDYGLGFHVPGHFDRVLDVEKCWLQGEELNGILGFTRTFFRDSGIPVYHVRAQQGELRFLVLRKSFASGQILVNLVTFSALQQQMDEYADGLMQAFPQISGVINTVNDTLAQIATGSSHRVVRGSNSIRENLGDLTFEITVDSFFQTNSEQALALYQVVKAYAGVDNQVVWDLYCGTGSIGIFLADKAREVLGFEIVENAVKDADYNAGLNQVRNCRFIAGDLRFQLQNHSANPPDVLICDPPRSGMHQDVLNEILRLAPARIVYVSCNPATMARDLQHLAEAYKILEVQPVDMFPHTYHIESVAKLEKQ